ncbi:hypothetical protein CTAYLR_004683 [Chrysophaeum taylorii]|uniref:Uncharacterized protein n=1 Tax=Chrysophaeum taylorii TaxID=2483200 RepID=A0AAD7U7M2_9STRA|nr:hypothetical protein CTAYLR_004683 [Chrysophaeum taylorii]
MTAPLSRSTILLQTAGSEVVVDRGAASLGSFRYLLNVRAGEGFVSFWKGNGASILQKMATTGSNYVVYEHVKNAMRPFWRSEVDVGFGVRVAAGVLAGGLNITLAYPLDIARTNISRGAEWASILPTLKSLYRHHGPTFLSRGLLTTQLCQGLNVGLHFGVYETLNTSTYFRAGVANTRDNRAPRSSFLHSMLCGAAAGLVASSIVQPLDLIRRRQQLKGSTDADKWFFQVANRILKKDGLPGLYRGILPELVKVCLFPASGVNFYVYELVRQDIFGERSGVR